MQKYVHILLVLALACNLNPWQEQEKGFEFEAWMALPVIFQPTVTLEELPDLNFPDPGERGEPCILREQRTVLPEEFTDVFFLSCAYNPAGCFTPLFDVPFSQQNPSAILYAQQNRELSAGNNIDTAIRWYNPAGAEFYNITNGGAITFNVQLMPMAKDDSLATGGGFYPTYESEQTYQVRYHAPGHSLPMDVHIWRSCTALSEQEKNFHPDTAQQTSSNGLSHVWDDYRHLNVHVILIHGEDHFPSEADLEPALGAMAEIFAQPTVKILPHFTTAIVEDATLLDITDEDSEDPETLGSYARLFAQTASVQVDDAVHVFFVRQGLSNYWGVLPVQGGNAASLPVSGGKIVGPLVFLQGYFSGLENDNRPPKEEMMWRDIGTTMAHEIGHAMGFNHIQFDDLVETPECSSFASDCDGAGFYDGGWRNLMYTGTSYTPEYVDELTGEQGYVLRLNPLSYR